MQQTDSETENKLTPILNFSRNLNTAKQNYCTEGRAIKGDEYE